MDGTIKQRRFARMYSGGSFNVAAAGEDEATALRRISGSQDDDDTQLVEVEIRVVRKLMHKGLAVVPPDIHLREVLEQAQSLLLDETPEGMSRDEARADTLEKIRRALTRW